MIGNVHSKWYMETNTSKFHSYRKERYRQGTGQRMQVKQNYFQINFFFQYFRMNGHTFRGSNLTNFFSASLLKRGHVKRKKMALLEANSFLQK